MVAHMADKARLLLLLHHSRVPLMAARMADKARLLLLRDAPKDAIPDGSVTSTATQPAMSQRATMTMVLAIKTTTTTTTTRALEAQKLSLPLLARTKPSKPR